MTIRVVLLLTALGWIVFDTLLLVAYLRGDKLAARRTFRLDDDLIRYKEESNDTNP